MKTTYTVSASDYAKMSSTQVKGAVESVPALAVNKAAWLEWFKAIDLKRGNNVSLQQARSAILPHLPPTGFSFDVEKVEKTATPPPVAVPPVAVPPVANAAQPAVTVEKGASPDGNYHLGQVKKDGSYETTIMLTSDHNLKQARIVAEAMASATGKEWIIIAP